MNKEIKEILECIEEIADCTFTTDTFELNFEDTKILLDYITNLQQENEKLSDKIEFYEDVDSDRCAYNEELQQENERLKKELDNKEFVFVGTAQNKTRDFIKHLIKEKNDYKSRCEKASECIKKDTRWFDSEYARVYGELCDCAGAKGDRLEVMINPSNALNILQDGGEDK